MNSINQLIFINVFISLTDDYPEHLNPFGDDDDEEDERDEIKVTKSSPRRPPPPKVTPKRPPPPTRPDLPNVNGMILNKNGFLDVSTFCMVNQKHPNFKICCFELSDKICLYIDILMSF